MKTYLLPLVGVTLGAMIAFHLFALLFTSSTAETFPIILLPFGLAAAASSALVWLDPNKWIVLTTSVALPTLLMSALIAIGLRMESRDDWNWALVAAAILSVCVVPGWFAHTRRI